ncbi:MAG: hypothetical protein AB203_04380 [Parcubacteria bacterium C7867-008]|nr:MAG: hypothetical protein AB203_04380 [Parcubacteria bacterium C7867-008]
MEAFFNDQKKKDQALASLQEHPIGKDGIDCFSYEAILGIPKEVGQWEDAILGELSPEDASRFPEAFLKRVSVGSDLTALSAHIVLWQFEDRTYGLKNIRGIRNDHVLLGFCEELVTLYREELHGTPIPSQSLQDLYNRAATAWSVVGEKQRVASMQFARKWAWAGARKWAWIPTKGWSGGWKWLLAGTRNRTRSGSVAMISAWSGAWKWLRFWESPYIRMRALRDAFLRGVK